MSDYPPGRTPYSLGPPYKGKIPRPSCMARGVVREQPEAVSTLPPYGSKNLNQCDQA